MSINISNILWILCIYHYSDPMTWLYERHLSGSERQSFSKVSSCSSWRVEQMSDLLGKTDETRPDFGVKLWFLLIQKHYVYNFGPMSWFSMFVLSFCWADVWKKKLLFFLL